MKLGSSAQEERFSHLFDEEDDARRGACVARLAQAIEAGEEIPYIGARVKPSTILEQSNASLRFDDYQVSVDVRKSLGSRLSPAMPEVDYEKLVAYTERHAREFAQAYERFMASR